MFTFPTKNPICILLLLIDPLNLYGIQEIFILNKNEKERKESRKENGKFNKSKKTDTYSNHPKTRPSGFQMVCYHPISGPVFKWLASLNHFTFKRMFFLYIKWSVLVLTLKNRHKCPVFKW